MTHDELYVSDTHRIQYCDKYVHDPKDVSKLRLTREARRSQNKITIRPDSRSRKPPPELSRANQNHTRMPRRKSDAENNRAALELC